ncbi:MAG TPA: putative quinol monooxygenase [Thermoanaerobaculia bacterium]|nr:putative quinol monooxygenase [Thermoanaerobaculia bacterium]
MVLTVIARARIQSGRESEMSAALLANAAASRGDAGCLSYSVIQGAEDPLLFGTVERWASKEAFDAHMATPHVQQLFAAITPLLASTPEIVAFAEL